MITTLNKLKQKESGIIVDIKADKKLKTKLLIMGLTNGTRITLNKIAPLGDPFDIIVRHYHLLIRAKEAKSIVINKYEL
ncbi:MAG: FeoA domain-containing protein [Rickettsiales bacterium]|nr:FeoA domain-containing protein [Rickettsiales bacterium]